MKLLFKQRAFSWFDSYDVYDEAGDTVFTVKGQLSWGKCLKIFDRNENEVATVEQRLFSWLTTFDIYIGEDLVGCVRKEFSFFHPRFTIDYKGWDVEGDFFEWDYSICGADGTQRAVISKELFNWTDTYSIDVRNSADALPALALVIAIDAEKEQRN
jgi:uncharacterized protein YxjI